ncbi:HET-domain-containing protein [Xylaria telfairii]|nr:HET-domain-containing protein [Xylaria telfairii]
MWFLNTLTYSLEERFHHRNIPEYAILSHTWGDEEVSFHEMREGIDEYQLKAGYQKIKKCCDIAAKAGIQFAWVDTCCIDKRHSTELSEALNSMYNYYLNARECYIYLTDVPTDKGGSSHSRSEQLKSVESSRWFTRGWTLQELIASSRRTFYSQDWVPIPIDGELMTLIANITGIQLDLLRGQERLSKYCIATRMSWVSRRTTTRPEDMAYCLMGIFNVSMPILYGEGLKKAFLRLQTEIMKFSFDQSIFIWRGSYGSSGLLANFPSDFTNTPNTLRLWAPTNLAPTTMTNVGLHARLLLCNAPERFLRMDESQRLAAVQCDILWNDGTWKAPFVLLVLLSDVHCVLNGQKCKAYRRIACGELPIFDKSLLDDGYWEDALVLQNDQYSLINHSIIDHGTRYRRGPNHTFHTHTRQDNKSHL